jgi:peptidoglycan/LPS O-acetylase OafA/YrhL
MSLERHGCLRRFWIGRLFRIYPAYLAAIAVLAVLVAAGAATWHSTLRAEPLSAVLAHVTMLSDPLGLRGAIRVFWTLSYEMVFYLIVAGLFAWRLHRYSAWWACGLALTAVVAGPALPDGLFASSVTGRLIAAAVLVLLTAGCIAAFLAGRSRLAGLLAIGFVLLPAVDGHPARTSMAIASWQGLALLAVMFAGTVIYRAQHGRLGRWPAAVALTVTAGAVIGAHWAHLRSPAAHAGWTLTVAAVAATFGLAYALRRGRVPRPWRFLGTISYSLYLLHVLVLMMLAWLVPDLAGRPVPARAVAAVAFLVVALGVAALSYRWIEVPGQALGRRIAARLDRSPITHSPTIMTERVATRMAGGEKVGASV